MNLSRIAYLLISLIAVVLILVYLKDILIPFVLALIVWFIIREVKALIKKIHFKGNSLPAWIRAILAFALIFGALGMVTSLLVTNIQGITEVLPSYQGNLKLLRNSIDQKFGIDIMAQLRDMSGDFNLTDMISTLLNSLTSMIGNAFLIIIYVIFLMLEESRFGGKLKAFYADKAKSERAFTILNQIDESLGRYVSLKTMVSLITGVLSYFALEIIGVDFAFFWAFLIFLLNFIPNIGSLIATLFPALIAGLQFGDLNQPLWVLLSVGTIQLIVGNFLEPKLMGDSLNISSLVVILGLAFWGSLWGIVGMFLSVPIMVMLVIIFAQFPASKGIAILLSDKGDVDKVKKA